MTTDLDDIGRLLDEVADAQPDVSHERRVETMEQAILTAARRTFGATRKLEARFNPLIGQVDLIQYMKVVHEVIDSEREISLADARRYGLNAELGEEIPFQIYYLNEDSGDARRQDEELGDLLGLRKARQSFGRIAVQTAKEVILQRVRDAERDNIYNEYADRKGEIIVGIVRRFERGSNIIVDLGRTEGVLPQHHQTPRETYRPGDRIVAYLYDIDREAQGPQITLSRSDVGLLLKLLELEVPEIYDGVVRIESVAREPGARSKIAVSSRDPDVDPVVACVGKTASRIQAVVQELRGEKIDIVPFERDAVRFVCNAIAPAVVAHVIIDEANNSMELIVPDDKLSLAIGRRGQNVRLASQLTGWRLDVIGESKFRVMEEEAIATFASIDDLDRNEALALYNHGFRTLDDVVDASGQQLASIRPLGPESLRASARQALEKQRLARLEGAASGEHMLDDKEVLTLIPGVAARTADRLHRAGYKRARDLEDEPDLDRLAIRTGLSAMQAHTVKSEASMYLRRDAHRVEHGQDQARERLAFDTQADDDFTLEARRSSPALDDHEVRRSDVYTFTFHAAHDAVTVEWQATSTPASLCSLLEVLLCELVHEWEPEDVMVAWDEIGDGWTSSHVLSAEAFSPTDARAPGTLGRILTPASASFEASQLSASAELPFARLFATFGGVHADQQCAVTCTTSDLARLLRIDDFVAWIAGGRGGGLGRVRAIWSTAIAEARDSENDDVRL